MLLILDAMLWIVVFVGGLLQAMMVTAWVIALRRKGYSWGIVIPPNALMVIGYLLPTLPNLKPGILGIVLNAVGVGINIWLLRSGGGGGGGRKPKPAPKEKVEDLLGQPVPVPV